VALLLPALGVARESARRTQCASQLRQLGVATMLHETAKRHFPAGTKQWYFNSSVSHRGIPLFAYLLPYLEQSAALVNWDYDNPIHNCDQGARSNTAVVLPLLLCPSDIIPTNPISTDQGWIYALTSYGGNGGSRSYFPQNSTADGIFHTTGEASEPKQHQREVRPRDITDGLSATLLFGERSHADPNYESFNAAGWGEPLDKWGWWGASSSRKMIGHVTMSAYAPINYRLPFSFSHRMGQEPPANSFAQFQRYVDVRVSAYGSGHLAGANFCFADGSTRFLESNTAIAVLRALSTRAGSE
jgi:prepilin-type processing-associated H-X9-DG protein